MQAVAPSAWPVLAIETVPAVSGARRRGPVREAGHADLARFHPVLATALARQDVLHATSRFALPETAVAETGAAETGVAEAPVGRRTPGRPGAAPVGSLHTEVPAVAGFDAPDIAARLPGGSRTVRRLPRRAGTGLPGRRLTRYRADRVDRVSGACRRQRGTAPADRAAPARRNPQATVGPPGCGIGLHRFGPILNDRYFKAQRYGIKEKTVVFCFAGRLETAACLAGPGGWAAAARLYTDSDLFPLPPRTRIFGVIVPDQKVTAWIVSTAPLVEDAGLRRRTGQQARRDMESRARSWDRIWARSWDRSRDGVFAEDLLPVRREAAPHAGSHAAARAG